METQGFSVRVRRTLSVSQILTKLLTELLSSGEHYLEGCEPRPLLYVMSSHSDTKSVLVCLGVSGSIQRKEHKFPQSPATCEGFASLPSGRRTYINSLIILTQLEQLRRFFHLWFFKLIKCEPQQLWSSSLAARWENRTGGWSSKKDAIQLRPGKQAGSHFTPLYPCLSSHNQRGESLHATPTHTQSL